MNGNKKIQKLKLEDLGRISLENYKQAPKTPITVVLDNVRSMNNVGSFFRTCDAFRIEKLILCGITPVPPHRDITKSALGATESVDWEYYEDINSALTLLQQEGKYLIGVEQVIGALSLEDFSVSKEKKYVLVFGNEVEGLKENSLTLYDAFIEIPQIGTKHSFNVSVSAGIVLWEFFKQLNE